MMNIYNANGFSIESDTKLYGWSTLQPNNAQYVNLRLISARFEVNYDGESWPYIYNYNSFIYFVWYGRLAFRISNDYTLAEYMLSRGDYEKEITFALNFVIAFIGSFINRIALHGCAVTNDKEEAVLILGDSGIGKSTLLRKLLDKGYSYLSEEVVFINALNRNVYCSNKLIRIKTELYDKNSGDEVMAIVGDKTAFWNQKFIAGNQNAKLKSICIIKRDTEIKPNVRELSKAEMGKYILGDYLYVKTVLRFLPFSRMIDMVTGILKKTETALYVTTDYPDVDIVTRILN